MQPFTYDGKILSIFNYKEIYNITPTKIEVYHLKVMGEMLMVVLFDGYELKIKGNIKNITIGD